MVNPVEKPLLIVGLNPSLASSEKSDAIAEQVELVELVELVAFNNDFDGFVMLKLYPVRSVDYRNLAVAVDKVAFEEDINRVEATVRSQSDAVIWAAWGASISHHGFFIAA